MVSYRPMTERQKTVLILSAWVGMRGFEIAEKISVSKRTVDDYLSRIYRTLGVNNRSQALRATLRLGHITQEDIQRVETKYMRKK